jgi:hypothetical protein
MKFPSIAAVAKMLRAYNREAEPDWSEPGQPDDKWCDVRLQVWPNGGWAVHCGDPSYDQDHRGYWGASCIPGARRRFNSTETARDLLEQVKESYSEAEYCRKCGPAAVACP